MRSMRVAGVLLAIAALLFGAACGREGAPGQAPSEQLSFPVAANVQVPGSATFAKMQQTGRVRMGVKND